MIDITQHCRWPIGHSCTSLFHTANNYRCGSQLRLRAEAGPCDSSGGQERSTCLDSCGALSSGVRTGAVLAWRLRERGSGSTRCRSALDLARVTRREGHKWHRRRSGTGPPHAAMAAYD
jgi:hypothetical protein